MIKNVAFTGRETMLTNGIKSAAKLAEEAAQSYSGIGKNYSKVEIANAKKLADEAKFFVDTPTMNTRIDSYVASHQPMQNVVEPALAPKAIKPNDIEHIDFFA